MNPLSEHSAALTNPCLEPGENDSAGDTQVEAPTTSPVGGCLAEAPESRVVLQVGEQRFHTTRSTLVSGSTYFRSLFSGDFANPRSEDGSYFVDADPEAFPIILRYLRHNILPTFFDKNQRFDQNLCLIVQAEALFFGVGGLIHWIRDKGYLKSFSTVHEVEERHVLMPSNPDLGPIWMFQGTVKPNTEQTFLHSRGRQMIYTCPRNIHGHDGCPERCGRQCQNAKRDLEAAGGTCFMDRGIISVLIVTKKTVFHDIEESVERGTGDDNSISYGYSFSTHSKRFFLIATSRLTGLRL